MSDQSDNYQTLLKPFGLSAEEAGVYLCLLERGIKSALNLSRELHLARTKVYRLLDKLAEKGLVTKKMDDLGFKFEAASYKQLELLVAQREHELVSLKDSLPLIYKKLAALQGKSKNESKILYYTGVEGLKQITWNSTKAKRELRLFELATMSTFLDYGFCEKTRQAFVDNRVRCRELSNLKQMPAWTKVTAFVKNYWYCRYFDPKDLKVRFEQLIYNDVYCLYSYQQGEIFCVEIYNQELAEMQKQLFDYMWLKAQSMKVLNDEGKAVLLTPKTASAKLRVDETSLDS